MAEKIVQSDKVYTDEEAGRRAREALRHSLTTPPKPQKDMVGKAGRGAKPPRSAPKGR